MTLRPPRPLSLALYGLVLLSLGACAPSLSPLYRDYEIETDDRPLTTRIESALTEAGWELEPAGAPNAVGTRERKVKRWGLYSVVVSLEVVPVGEDYVRLYIHPYRRYFTGSRSKIPFFPSRLRRTLLDDLNEAFHHQGLTAIGTFVERDRRADAR